uniref:AtC3H23-like CCCH zinc finger domain-containing protein n=1 Tax=Chenopodium quinoa TaxID=63459 RepID=A0A803MA85_CHEQI
MNKIRPCSRAYSHDWTECPFVHPGENVRRRDPRKYHYSCVLALILEKELVGEGICAVNMLMGPLYVSTGSVVPSPRSSASSSIDIAAAMNFMPGSPSSLMSPSAFTPPMSPSAANGISHSSLAWPQPNVPSLRLPGSNLQSSRLRSSLNARDIAVEEFEMLQDYDLQQQLLSEFSCLSMNPNSLNRSNRSKTLNPSNLDDLFSAKSLYPRHNDPRLGSCLYSPTHKFAVFNQFQQQQQGMLSPINTNFSPKGVADHPLLSGRMSLQSVEPISPMSARASLLAQREQQLHHFRSLSSRDLGTSLGAIVGSPVHSWSRWGSSNGKPDWGTNTDELGKLGRSSSFELGNNGEEPDLSWIQSLVKESPTDIKEKVGGSVSSAVDSSYSKVVDLVERY